MQEKAVKNLVAENEELRVRLQEAQDTLDAIRRGEVDGLVVSTPKGEQVYTISGAERPYRALIEEMREGALMLSDDNTVLYANKGFAQMMKSPLEKIVGTNIEKLVSPANETALKKLLFSVRKGNDAITKEITFTATDGSLVPTQASVNTLRTDTLHTAFLVLTDLTQHMNEEVKRYTQELELAQIALSESEQRWSTTLSSIGDAVIATDTLGKVTFMNGVAENLTGWRLSEASGKPVQQVFKIINEFSRKTIENPVLKVMERGLIVGLANHTILIRKNSTEVAIDDSGAPIKNKDGQTMGVVLIFRDISERKIAEEAIRISELRFRSLAENAPDVIMRFDTNLRVLYINGKVQVATGISPEKFVGRTNEEVGMPKELVQMWNDLFNKASTSKQAQQAEFDFPSPGGIRTFDLRVVPEYSKDGLLTSFLGISRDVTERKQAEIELEKYRKELERLVEERTKKLELSSLYARNLIEASLDPLVTISIEGKITDVNKATELATGRSRTELIGSDFSSYFIDPEKAKVGYKKVFSEGVVRDYPLAIRHRNGKVIDVLYNATIYRNPAGEIQGVFAAARDITELRKAEEEVHEASKKLKDAERLAAIGATAGMVGHDIRNPLQSIMCELYLAKTEISPLPESTTRSTMIESLGNIENEVKYISKIVQDLQDFARPLAPKALETDIEKVFDDVLAKNAIPQDIKVTHTVKADAKKLIADPDLLKRILTNLVNNAVQAMPDGGKLSVKSIREENDLVITVEDTGIGIPENVKPKLFTPLFSTKSKGQGFGLSVVKRMTEALGGTVTFESEIGKGTKFTVRLPPKK